MTQLYDVFGGTLRSELLLADIPESSGRTPDWTLHVIDGDAAAEGELLGSDTVYG